MTSKTLTDSAGDTLRTYPWLSGRVLLSAQQGEDYAMVGPFKPADLIAAISEAAGETSCDAVAPGSDYQCTRERGHITEHVAVTIDGEVCETWPVEADEKCHCGKPVVYGYNGNPKDTRGLCQDCQDVRCDAYPGECQPAPAPSKSPTAEDFAREWFRAAEPRPLTPDAITDEMVKRGVEKFRSLPTTMSAHARVSIILTAALTDPPAPVTPAWHNARIVEATCRGRECQWARTATDGLWVSLDGESREAYTPDLSDVSIVVPAEVEA